MIVDDWDQDNIDLMVTVTWSIWCNRNEVQNGGKRTLIWNWCMGREFFCRNIKLQYHLLINQNSFCLKVGLQLKEVYTRLMLMV